MGWMLVAAGKLGGTVVGTDDVAEGIQLRGTLPGAESERTKCRLEQQQIRRDKRDRYAPRSPRAVQTICL